MVGMQDAYNWVAQKLHAHKQVMLDMVEAFCVSELSTFSSLLYICVHATTHYVILQEKMCGLSALP